MDATSRKVIVARTIHQWPEGYHTKSYWKYECDRRIKKGAKPSIVEIEGRQIPVFHYSQTYVSKRKRTELQDAQHEYLRRFWLYARHDLYLFCDAGTSTIDYHAQHERGSDVPWFSEALMVQHLRGESVYGLFAQESYPRRPARTYWVASTSTSTSPPVATWNCSGNRCGSSCGISGVASAARSSSPTTVANGLHLYLFFKRPQDLDRARDALRSALSASRRRIPNWSARSTHRNETLRRAGKTWKVKQIGDLEIYPDQKHGFRFIGTRGKVVLADKEIGTVQWGTYPEARIRGR